LRAAGTGDSLSAVTNRDRMLALGLAIGAVAGVLTACNAPKPNIREGDADMVQVTYGGDVATAWPLARKHCAQYERVPRLADVGVGENGLDLANFDCIRP
jgi:hypothetical protein